MLLENCSVWTIRPNHCYIKLIGGLYDLKHEKDLAKFKNKKDPVVMWNPHSYLVSPKNYWKYDVYCHRKKNNLRTIVMERGALPETLFLDVNGFLGESSSYDKKYWENGDPGERINEYIRNFKKSHLTLEPQNDRGNVNIKGKKIFVPLQVPRDTNIQMFSDWLCNYGNFYKLIQEVSKRFPDCKFLIKRHPNHDAKIKLTDNMIFVDNHYKDLIDCCDVVINMTSSVGLQALMWNKPVIVTGNAFYHHDSLTMKANCFADVVKFIENPRKPNWENVRKFISYLNFDFYYHCKMKKTGKNSSKPIGEMYAL